LEGLEAFGIHGTWSSSATWENQEALSEVTKTTYGNNESNFGFNWSGDNLSSARSEAALELISYVRANRSEDLNEPITLMGHSHGGNVAIEAVNMMSGMEEFNGVNINLVTINTPVRDDYQLSDAATARVEHVNVYDAKDPVQIRGGNDPSKFTGDTKVNTLKPYTVEAGKRNGLTMTGEKGEAGRTFKNAINIKTTNSQGVTGDFHNSHNRVKDWKNEFLLKAGQ
jgi:pimeloyl-ACP methyl ester carboxylesterase